MNGLRLALSFLTTLPVLSASYTYDDTHWKTAVFWFPLIGGLVGGTAWLVGWLALHGFASGLAATLAVVAWAAMTGGLHLDGVADCGDGLLAAAPPARRLEIMRDPRVGAFGAITLILFLALKVSAVQGAFLAERGWAIVLAAALGRSMMVWLARQPMARPGGMGALFAAQIKPLALLVVTLLPSAALLLAGWRGGAALLAASLTTGGIAQLARRRLGGVTGDLYGLTIELVELAVLLPFATQP